MDIVSPVMTFDIGAIVPSSSSEKQATAKAINIATDYVQDFLSDQFAYYIEWVKKIENIKKRKNESLTSDDCMKIISLCIQYDEELNKFNSNPKEKSYIFFDNFYYCMIDTDGALQYDNNGKIEKFMYNHLSSIKKVHDSINYKYDNNIDNHFIIFTNFFITIRNKPFMKTGLIIDDNDNVNFCKVN